MIWHLSTFSSTTGDGGLRPLEQALYFSMFFGLAFDRVWPALAELCNIEMTPSKVYSVY